jgi:hypothetical protein
MQLAQIATGCRHGPAAPDGIAKGCQRKNSQK